MNFTRVRAWLTATLRGDWTAERIMKWICGNSSSRVLRTETFAYEFIDYKVRLLARLLGLIDRNFPCSFVPT